MTTSIDQPRGFEYIPSIPPTEGDAKAIQALTLQDVVAGKFRNPTDLADPEDPDKIAQQLQRLAATTKNYSGYRHESGSLAAYMKSGEWRVGDELPFVEGMFASRALYVASKFRKGSLRPKTYGVFGLVADESLRQDEREMMLHALLSQSIGQAAVESAAVINIVLHEQDPASPIALDLEFHPVGRPSEATGAPGLVQQRYQRISKSSDGEGFQ